MELMLEVENEIKDVAEDKRVYELGCLLMPTLTEEEVLTAHAGLKDLISSLQGEFIFDEMAKMIPLAYTMTKIVSNVKNKFDTAYFGWVKFFMDAEKVLELKKKIQLNPNLIRFLIIKTVKENTIASKRFINRDSAYRRTSFRKSESVETNPMNKEEVDKEIDAMVAI